MKEPMSEGDRLQLICDALYNGNQAALGRTAGIALTAINKLIRGRGAEIGLKLGRRYIDRICIAIPAVNRKWLETGLGYPGDLSVDLVKKRYEELLEAKDAQINKLQDIIAEILQSKK